MGDIEMASFRSGSDGGTLQVDPRARPPSTLHPAFSAPDVRGEIGMPIDV